MKKDILKKLKLKDPRDKVMLSKIMSIMPTETFVIIMKRIVRERFWFIIRLSLSTIRLTWVHKKVILTKSKFNTGSATDTGGRYHRI